MERKDFIESAPVYYALAIWDEAKRHVGRSITLSSVATAFSVTHNKGRFNETTEYLVEKEYLLEAGLRWLVESGLVRVKHDAFGESLIIRQDYSGEPFEELRKTNPAVDNYEDSADGRNWIRNALRRVNQSADSFAVGESDFSPSNSIAQNTGAAVGIGGVEGVGMAGSMEPGVEDVHAQVQQAARRLDYEFGELQSYTAGIGHNNPPESLSSGALTPNEISEVREQLAALQGQDATPTDKGQALQRTKDALESKWKKIGVWLKDKADVFAENASKSSGTEFGKWAPRVLWALIFEHFTGLLEKIGQWLTILKSMI